ncbi:Protein fmp52, mitochondrial [Vanrija albida]|uniref:Protein fmp52, mitochondrial n=1 Tax=Vanrija albida TaxID=181172 RepID=A0ABR3Q7U4_9TREE
MPYITIVGGTGLVGGAALSSLLASPTPLAITALTRRALPAPAPANPGTTLTPYLLPDLADAVAAARPLAGPGATYITALGATRAAAGGLAGQERIDFALNRDLAARARADGAETIILVSSGGADAASYSGYLRIKGLLEDAVLGMGYARTVILRPGVLLGRPDARAAEAALGYMLRAARFAGLPTERWGIDAADVGAAVAQLALESGEGSDGVRYVEGGEMVALAAAWRAQSTSS